MPRYYPPPPEPELETVWNGSMDRDGLCPSLLCAFSRPSTLCAFGPDGKSQARGRERMKNRNRNAAEKAAQDFAFYGGQP